MVKIYNFYVIDPFFHIECDMEIPCFSPVEARNFINMNRRAGNTVSTLGIRFIAEDAYNEGDFLP